MRADVDPALIGYTLLAIANWTGRWLRKDGPLPLNAVVDGYCRMLWEGLALAE